MKSAYGLLLRLYPRDYRIAFSAEMSGAFENAAAERRAQGGPALLYFVLVELFCLTRGAAAEWRAKLTTSSFLRGRTLPDPLMMRPPGVSRDAWFRD